MTNEELAQRLQEFGCLLTIGGYPEAKAARLARLARTITHLSEPVEQLCREGRLESIAGVGPATAALLSEYLATGTCRWRRRWEQAVPPSALELLTIPGLGLKTARFLFQQCGVESLSGLETAVRQDALRGLDRRALKALRDYFLRQRRQRLDAETLALAL
jgi:DNA polymerase (family 10)